MDILAQLFPSTIAAVAAIASAYIASKNKQEAEKTAKVAQEYRDRREEIDVAKWKVLLSTMEGVTVLLHHAKGEKLNGNVESALSHIEESRDKLTQVQIKNIVKE